MSIKRDEYGKDWNEFMERHILVYWTHAEIVNFCARLLGVEAETLRAWLARREDRQS